MNESKISVRYAKALSLLSRDKDILEIVKDDMTFIMNTILTLPEFTLLLESPIIKSSEKQNIIHKIFGNKIHEITLSFLDIIIKNKREIYIKDICRRFLYLYKKHKGIKTAVLTTAVPVGTEIINNITKMIKTRLKTEVEMYENVNDELIGGFILRIEDLQYDASISSELKKIKKELISTTVD